MKPDEKIFKRIQATLMFPIGTLCTLDVEMVPDPDIDEGWAEAKGDHQKEDAWFETWAKFLADGFRLTFMRTEWPTAGAGCPVYRFTGTELGLRMFINSYYDGDDDSAQVARSSIKEAA